MSDAKPTWDPVQYTKFADLRGRPADELLARSPANAPLHVFDLGCGNGAVTRRLRRRWPAARITGIDSSAEMLAGAQELDPTIAWREADIATWAPSHPVAVIFSNAALQWLPDHARFFPRLLGFLSPGGCLAVQMPRNHQAPSHRLIREAGTEWADKILPNLRDEPVAEPNVYYDILAPHAALVDIWETAYLQVLRGEDPVTEWVKGTALRPVEQALTATEWREFLKRYSKLVARAYPPRPDGATLLPFRRLFLVARR